MHFQVFPIRHTPEKERAKRSLAQNICLFGCSFVRSFVMHSWHDSYYYSVLAQLNNAHLNFSVKVFKKNFSHQVRGEQKSDDMHKKSGRQLFACDCYGAHSAHTFITSTLVFNAAQWYGNSVSFCLALQ